MKIRQIRAADTVILHLSGHLGVGKGVQALRAAVQQVMAAGSSGLILDLSGVGYLDAAGIGALVATHRDALRHGRRVVLTGLRARVQDILGLAGVDHVLDCARDQDAALDHVQYARGSEGPLTAGSRPGAGVTLKTSLV